MADPTETPVLDNNIQDQGTSESDRLPGWARDMIDSRFKKLFGRNYDLDKAIDLLEKISSGGEIADEDIIDIGLMYAHYLQHHQKSTMSAELLLIYMNQISPTTLTPTTFQFDEVTRRVVVSESSVRALPKFDIMVASNAISILERAIQKRLDNPDDMHPGSAATFDKPDGSTENVTPSISPMKAGGTETIYCEYNIQLPDDSTRPIKQALGTITVFSKMTVTSTPSDDGTLWTVSLDTWENWGYDEGDFEWDELSMKESKKKNQEVAISFEDLLPHWLPGKKRLEKAVKDAFPELQWMLDRFMIDDKYMSQVLNKVINLPDGSVFNPQKMEIYIEEWTTNTSQSAKNFETTYSLTTA